jgi:hypothetical protein
MQNGTGKYKAKKANESKKSNTLVGKGSRIK